MGYDRKKKTRPSHSRKFHVVVFPHLGRERGVRVLEQVPEPVLKGAAESEAEVLVHVLVDVHALRKKPETLTKISVVRLGDF